MADSRQTKIVEYKLQGDTTDLQNELKAAVASLDLLDQKLTDIAQETRNRFGKPQAYTMKRASTVSAAETQIGKMRKIIDPRVLQAVSPDQLNLIKQMVIELNNANADLNKFKNSTTVTQKALDKTKVTLRALNKALRDGNLTLSNSKHAWTKFTEAVNKATRTLNTIRLVAKYLYKAYEAASEFVEVMNLFNVATQQSRNELLSLAEALADAYNTDIRPILNSIATFRQFANTMGFATEQADLFSEYLTKISLDLASLYNTTNKEMFDDIRSAIAGQTKPLMKYGISVHKATLEQYALNLGITKSWSAFTETEKVALRYIAILDQASLAQGDLAKTLESPSNQFKIAKAQLEILIRNLGALVTIVTQYVLPVVNGLAIAINTFLSTLSLAAGYEIPDYSSNLSANTQVLSEGTEAAEEYEEAIRGALAPLDEINQQNNNGAQIGGIDPDIMSALEKYNNLMDKVNTKTDVLANTFAHILSPEIAEGVGSVLGSAFDVLGSSITAVTQALTLVSPVLAVVLDLVGLLLQGAAWLIDHIVSPVLSFVVALTDNIWLLIGAFAALNLMQLAVTGEFKSMMIVKIISWFKALTVSIWENIAAMIAHVAHAIKVKAAALITAAAIWAETAAWWQKAIAIIAAAGALALVVGGIVLAATSSAKSQADRTMASSMPSMPAMASGGIVSSPTVALIGEGHYREAVVPLGNSPQFKSMKDDIADEVLRKIGPTPYSAFGQHSRGASTPVIMQLNGREVARALFPDLADIQPQMGVSLK